MATTKLNIGKIPISKGEYQDGTTYQRLNQVTMLGSTYQSKIDDNTSAPAQIGADGAVENINTDKWLCIAVGNVSAAKKVVYNNEISGLEAGNVQEAIDETNTKVSNLNVKSIYSTHVDWHNGDDNIVIPVSFSLKKGESITLVASNVNVTYNGNDPKHWALTLSSGGHFIQDLVIYSEGAKTYVATKDMDITAILVNINIGIETLSFDIKLGSGEIIKQLLELQKNINNNATNIARINSLMKEQRYTVSKDNPNKSFYNDFKAGDVIKISVSNFNYEGSGAMAVFLNDGTENVYHLDFRNLNIDDYTVYVTLVRDCSYIVVGCALSEGITTISADFAVLYTPNVVKNTLKIESQRESGCWRKLLNYSNYTGRFLSIVYPFKAGELLVLVVNSLETNAPKRNIVMRVNKALIIKDIIGYSSYVLENDTNVIDVSMYQDGGTDDFTADVEVLYGKDAENYIKEQNELPFLDVEEEVFSKNGTVTDWIYLKKAYVGYKKPFNKNCIIKNLTISSYGSRSSQHSYIGKEYNFVIGTIDQRNWLLPRITFTAQIKGVMSDNDIIYFDFSDDTIVAREGEVIFIEMTPTSERNVLCGLSPKTYDANNEFMITPNLDTALTSKSPNGCSYYILETIPFNTIFVQKDEIKSLQSQVNSLQNRLNTVGITVGIYEDRITGIKYHITVSNGNIVLQSLNIKSLMVIGHSFVNYGNSPEVDWYLDDGENRAMAASVNEHQWTSLIKNKLELTTLKLVSGVDFERNYSTDYDFASKWKVTDVYDAICIYLCENAVYNDTMQESWEAMLRYLKSAAPKARIFCTGSWVSNNKQQAIQAACENVSDIVYVNMLPIYTTENNKSVNWNRGDYYYGRESTYYPIGAASGHPNDKGMLDIANTFLNYMGVEQIKNKTHNITLNQTSGGIIGTPNVEWLENGIVTIRCTPDSGHSIQSVSVQKSSVGSIEVTRRTNNYYDNETEMVYYTFTMPNEDVVVTPEWTIV